MQSETARETNRIAAFAIVAAVYALAFCVGSLVYGLFGGVLPLAAMFAADAAATLIVWLAGVVYSNSSLYDPYWSVAPAVMVAVWFVQNAAATIPNVLIAVAFLVWGLRLTVNWAVRWKGIAHQDWRYTMYRDRSPKLWFFTNLFGINLMPTVLVYVGTLPAYGVLASRGPLGALTVLGFAVCVCAALTQLVADNQLQAFRERGEDGCIDEGLWHFSRHPNYLGEVGFWWGVYLMGLGAGGPWYGCLGALLITLLFVFVSIPMMEKHLLAARPDYARYQREVSMLLPLPRRARQ